MSALASFYLLDSDQLRPLLNAAAPRRHEVRRALGLLKPKVIETYPIHPFLEEHATRLPTFCDSGWAFVPLELMLEAQGVSLFRGAALAAESEQLSAHLKNSLALFDYARAQALLTQLQAVALTPNQVTEFLVAEYGEAEPLSVEAVLAAFRQAQAWLGQVGPHGLGLLWVG
ncbi:hypothetical protein [Hyalangium gracile]|uniref:hypothetical protein n=1 Tax=Hyalangium gracile TaxID=394092 RepID=UPI001CD01435|nr:hypothetical protein [Hyalangium gracile]